MDGDGPTLRESILGNRGIREKGARRGQRGGKRRRRRGRPRVKGRILPYGPFPSRSQDGHFLRSQSTVIGYCSQLLLSSSHGNRAAVSNLLFKILLIPLEGKSKDPRLDDKLTNRRFVSLHDDDDDPPSQHDCLRGKIIL